MAEKKPKQIASATTVLSVGSCLVEIYGILSDIRDLVPAEKQQGYDERVTRLGDRITTTLERLERDMSDE